jgi:transposase
MVSMRIAEIFDIEGEINGLSAARRHSIRQVRVAPLVTSLEQWMRGERARLSHHADVAKAIDYMLKHWKALHVSSAMAGFAS